MKLNLSGKGFKGLLLRHGEKIGMVIVGACVALFLYSAAGRERLPAEKQHDVLMQRVNTSKQKIDAYTWEQALQASEEVAEGEEPVAKLPEPIPGTATADVPVEQYVTAGTGWDRAVMPQTELRRDPELLAVTDLEVHGWSAIVPRIDETTRRKRAIEEAKRMEDERKKAEKAAADMADAARRGGQNRGREGGVGGRFGEEGMPGGGMIDPDHPDRRLAPPVASAEGIGLQGDERLDIVYGVTVLGKVPVEEQQKAYRAALENAKGGYDPLMRDRPQYMAAYVERAEVTDDGKELQWAPVRVRSGTGKPAWSGVSAMTLSDAVQDWPAEMEDISDQRYIHPILTFPLPPLVGQNWGDRGKHSEVTLQADFRPEEEMENAAKPDAAPAEGDDTDIFGPGAIPPGGAFGAEGRGGFGGRPRGGFGSGRGGFMGEEGGMRGEMGGFGGRGGFMGEGGMEGGFGGRGGMGGARRDLSNMADPMPEKPFWMFRFFDMNAEPGKQYRYRVKLVLKDVNGYVSRNFLDQEVIARLPAVPKVPEANPKPLIRQTAWSEPSPIASVPMAGEVRIAAVTPVSTRQANAEPAANLLVKSFDVDSAGKAIQAALEREFHRGSVMNFIADVEYQVGQYIDKAKGFRFRTGATLVDIRPGKQLPGDMMSPSKILVMDAGGRLAVRDELKDIGEVELHRLIFAKPDPSEMERGGFFGGRGGLEGGRGGFEGEF